jgi:hypothetical protein
MEAKSLMDNKMNKLNLSAPWPEVKEKIKESNIELTDQDLEFNDDQELLKHLSKKMNRTPEEVQKWIESVAANKGKAS